MVFPGDHVETPPLYKAMQSYLKKNNISFHVPLHGRNAGVGFLLPLKGDISSFLHFDLTELPGLDDLHLPREAIKASQDLTALLFNARESFFLVNGVTAGILSVFLSLCQPGDKVLLSRLSHKAVLHGVVLSGAYPVYLPVEQDPFSKMPLNVSPGIVKKALEAHPDARLLVITSPSYWGVAADLSAIKKIASVKNMAVVVDEAHGAHFPFYRQKLPHSAASEMDIWLHSAHKSLGALTPSALLHSNLSNSQNVRFWLQAFQTSSPSYPLMLSLDLLRYYLALIGDKVFMSSFKWALTFRRELISQGVPFLSLTEVKRNGFYLDPARITILSSCGRGEDMALRLSKSGLQFEMYGSRYILAITGPSHMNLSPHKLARRVARTQNESMKYCSRKSFSHYIEDFPPCFFRKRCFFDTGVENENAPFSLSFSLPPAEALKGLSRSLPLEESAGEVSAEMVVLSPPGIPLLSPGEDITEEMVSFLIQQRALNKQFQGAEDVSLSRIKVVL